MITESASDRNEVSFMNIRHKRKEKEESVSTARELFQWVAAIVAAVLIALAKVSYSSKGSSDFPEKRLRSGMERSI